jgi:hypothetical protein
LAYYSWNKYESIDNFSLSHDKYHAGIDRCSISNNSALGEGVGIPENKRAT